MCNDRQKARCIAVDGVQPGDDDRQVEGAGAETRDRLLRDFAGAAGGRPGDVGAAERAILFDEMPGILDRRVDGAGGHHQGGLGAAAMLQDTARSFAIDPHGAIEIGGAAAVIGEVQYVGEIRRQSREIAFGDINGDRFGAECGDAFPRRGVGEAGGAPHPRCRQPDI